MKPIFRLLSLLLLLVAATARAELAVPLADDLAADGRDATARGVAVLLVFSAEHCGYCEKLEENVLRPLLVSGAYDDKVLVRKVMVDDARTLVDFDGRERDSLDLADRYRAYLTPTVLLVDARGRPLAPRLRGINSVDYYWEDLDGAIDQALAKLRTSGAIARTE
ncbi:thioredoxin family protein [Endothiovibrio diazotrophicus]